MTMSDESKSPQPSPTSETSDQSMNQAGVSKEFLEDLLEGMGDKLAIVLKGAGSSKSSGPKMEIRRNKDESSKGILDSARSVRDIWQGFMDSEKHSMSLTWR